MELENVTNMAAVSNKTNGTLNNTLVHVTVDTNPDGRPYVAFFAVLIIVINSTLIAFFHKHRRGAWTTFFFLTNLTITDILIGFSMIFGITTALLLPENVRWIVCNVFTSPMAVMSPIMSGWCIFIISIQVPWSY